MSFLSELSRWPRVQLLDRSNLQADYQHGVLISLLRGLAAVEVVAAHLRAQLFPSLKTIPDPTLWYQALAFFTGFAHQAVVMFFVLSGWLVGGSLLNKLGTPGLLPSYAIDRITRLWVVLIPAFIFTLLISMLAGDILPHDPDFAADNPYSFTAFIGNLFGLQDTLVPRFGGNFALWSLANETWYYLLFPLLLMPRIASSLAARLGGLVLAAIALLILNGDLVLYFGVWLMGVGFSRLRIDAPAGARGLLLAALLCASVYYRMKGSNDILVADSLLQDVLLSALFLAWLASLQYPADMRRPATRLAARAGGVLAGFSFTLYVMHVPLLVMLREAFADTLGAKLRPDSLADFGLYSALLVAIVGLAWLFHLPFEAQTGKLRRMVKQLLASSRVRPGGLMADQGR